MLIAATGVLKAKCCTYLHENIRACSQDQVAPSLCDCYDFHFYLEVCIRLTAEWPGKVNGIDIRHSLCPIGN